MKAIVFVLRGCSAGWLGAYGNESIATPHLDRFAAEGVVFDRHISDYPQHSAACRAWLAAQPDLQTPPDNHPLLRTLRTAGVRTVLVRANHPETDAPEWFYAGWDELFDVRPQEEDRFALDSLVRLLPVLLERLSNIESYLLWVDIDSLLPPWRVRQEVFDAYVEDIDDEPTYEKSSESEVEGPTGEEELEEVNGDLELDENEVVEEEDYTDEPENDNEIDSSSEDVDEEPVTPWSDPPTGPFDMKDADAREWLQCSLAAVVTGIDAELGVVFDQLRSQHLDRNATWLITSDHGYPLGEHGQIGQHRPWLYEELVHLPLILRFPEAKESCRRVANYTQPQDLAPTLLDLFGLNSGSITSAGSSMLPLARGEDCLGRECAITKLELDSAAELSIRTEDWAFLLPTQVPEEETREPQLFGKPDDRWEVNDVRAQNIERCDQFQERLRLVE